MTGLKGPGSLNRGDPPPSEGSSRNSETGSEVHPPAQMSSLGSRSVPSHLLK